MSGRYLIVAALFACLIKDSRHGCNMLLVAIAAFIDPTSGAVRAVLPWIPEAIRVLQALQL